MFSWEKRWLRAVLEAFAPDPTDVLALGETPIDYLDAFLTVKRSSTPRARLGLHLALWLVALSPMWLCRTRQSMAQLPLHERAQMLERLLTHPRYIVRELTTLLKLIACIAIWNVDSIRARSGCESTGMMYTEEVSGTRPSLSRLPVLQENPASAEHTQEVA